jgi:translation initiation factor 2B subunit (eIF-2B alpha/beta/delta family)
MDMEIHQEDTEEEMVFIKKESKIMICYKNTKISLKNKVLVKIVIRMVKVKDKSMTDKEMNKMSMILTS